MTDFIYSYQQNGIPENLQTNFVKNITQQKDGYYTGVLDTEVRPILILTNCVELFFNSGKFNTRPTNDEIKRAQDINTQLQNSYKEDAQKLPPISDAAYVYHTLLRLQSSNENMIFYTSDPQPRYFLCLDYVNDTFFEKIRNAFLTAFLTQNDIEQIMEESLRTKTPIEKVKDSYLDTLSKTINIRISPYEQTNKAIKLYGPILVANSSINSSVNSSESSSNTATNNNITSTTSSTSVTSSTTSKNNNINMLIGLLFLIVVIVGAYYYFKKNKKIPENINK
jgi:hypothetical protein